MPVKVFPIENEQLKQQFLMGEFEPAPSHILSARMPELESQFKGAVLIAEDNRDDTLLLCRNLKRIGVDRTVRCVENGAEIISYVKGEGQYSDRAKFPYPVLLILDLRMSPVDGFGVLRWLNSNPHKVFPVLIVTVSEARHEMLEAYRLGAATFLTKPITQSALQEAIDGLKVRLRDPDVRAKSPENSV